MSSKLILCLAASSAFAQVIALTNATVIDGTGAAPRTGVTIVMSGGRIADIGPNVKAPKEATVVDARGKFITPGIINAHGHVGDHRDPQLRQYALYGVTTTTSMATDSDDIVAFKESQRRGDLRGARILTVKQRFSTLAAEKLPSLTLEFARSRVDEIAPSADFIKVWVDAQEGRIPKLTPEFCAAVFEQARKHGKTTMAHIVTYDDAKTMVDLGVNILVHNVRDREIDDAFIALLKNKNVSVISTLAREEATFIYGQNPSFMSDPFFLKALRADQTPKLDAIREEQAKLPNIERLRASFATDKTNLKKLVAAGVRVGFGTDSGGRSDRFFIQGWAEHRQMELAVEAGLTPMQVIQLFSKGSSEVLGLSKDFGTLAKGKAADLIVLNKNPLDNITNMRAIDAVYLGGRKFE